MSLETTAHCPACGKERAFWRVASTTLHLGRKVKYRCVKCDHGIVTVEGAVDASEA